MANSSSAQKQREAAAAGAAQGQAQAETQEAMKQSASGGPQIPKTPFWERHGFLREILQDTGILAILLRKQPGTQTAATETDKAESRIPLFLLAHMPGLEKELKEEFDLIMATFDPARNVVGIINRFLRKADENGYDTKEFAVEVVRRHRAFVDKFKRASKEERKATNPQFEEMMYRSPARILLDQLAKCHEEISANHSNLAGNQTLIFVAQEEIAKEDWNLLTEITLREYFQRWGRKNPVQALIGILALLFILFMLFVDFIS